MERSDTAGTRGSFKCGAPRWALDPLSSSAPAGALPRSRSRFRRCRLRSTAGYWPARLRRAICGAVRSAGSSGGRPNSREWLRHRTGAAERRNLSSPVRQRRETRRRRKSSRGAATSFAAHRTLSRNRWPRRLLILTGCRRSAASFLRLHHCPSADALGYLDLRRSAAPLPTRYRDSLLQLPPRPHGRLRGRAELGR